MHHQRVRLGVGRCWQDSWRTTFVALSIALLSLGAIGCGGGDAGVSSQTEVFGTNGISLPSEVSAVSSLSEPESPEGMASIMSRLEPTISSPRALGDLTSDADYHTVVVRKFVEIKALEVFQILSSIFDGVRQTHYEDHAGGGWYKTMVAFQDTGADGTNQTRLEEWYVNSRMFQDPDGTLVNRVQLKIMSNDASNGERFIRVETDITQAPTQNADGTLADMGAWEIRAVFGDEGASSFHATAEILENGQSQVTLEESFSEGVVGAVTTNTTRALIVRSESSGYGKVEYADWDACMPNADGTVGSPITGGRGGNPCENGAPSVEVQFSYNDRYLKLQVGTEAAVSYDREDAHELVHRYGLFEATTGEDIDKTKSFGFPVLTADGDHGWYGAWQERHELWLRGQAAETGITVTREGLPSAQVAPTFTTKRFQGVLTKAGLEEGSMNQLDGLVTEIYLWNSFRLRWNDSEGRFDECIGTSDVTPISATGEQGCDTQTDFTEKLAMLQMPGENDQRWVYIGGCNEDSPGNWTCTNYVYDQGAFWVATQGQTRMEKSTTPMDTEAFEDGHELWASVGGQIYIEYTGEFGGTPTSTGWVQKAISSFDDQSWIPTFDDASDSEFVFELGREYFVNQRGSNLRVTRVAENGDVDDYAVYMEVHRVAKPVADLTSFLAAGAKLVDAWDPENSSKYVLNRDSSSDNYLLLEFDTLSDPDEGDGFSIGDVVPNDMWGLRIDGDDSMLANATLYNWEYQDTGESWGGVTYLVDQFGDFFLLDEPLHFDPIALARADDLVQSRPEDDWLSYSLGYDGWLHGVPDPWFELQRIRFTGDGISAVLANNVRIPDGTILTAEDSSTYFVKALDIGIFLGEVTAFPNGTEPSLTNADAVDLDAALPVMPAVTMDTTLPSSAELLYVEGLPVDDGEQN